MSRKFVRENGSLRGPRESDRIQFVGTPLYTAVCAYIGREYYRKDDIESWFYVMVEMYKGNLPWGHIADTEQIGKIKSRRLPNNPPAVRIQALWELIAGCPAASFGQILKHIDDLKFYGQPDYRWIMQRLRDHQTKNRIPERPYDFEAGAPRRPAAATPMPIPGLEVINSYFI